MLDTKIKLSNNKIEQISGETLNLSGNTIFNGGIQFNDINLIDNSKLNFNDKLLTVSGQSIIGSGITTNVIFQDSLIEYGGEYDQYFENNSLVTKKYVDINALYDVTIIPCSDETTDLTTKADAVEFQMPFNYNLTGVSATVSIAPSGSTIQVDINQNQTSILDTVISIDVGEKTSETAAVPPVINDNTLDINSVITIDIDQVGSTIPGTGLKVYLKGFRT